MPTVFAVRSRKGNVSDFVIEIGDTSKLMGLHRGDGRSESREDFVCGVRRRGGRNKGRRWHEQGNGRLLFCQSENLTLDIAIPTSRSDALRYRQEDAFIQFQGNTFLYVSGPTPRSSVNT